MTFIRSFGDELTKLADRTYGSPAYDDLQIVPPAAGMPTGKRQVKPFTDMDPEGTRRERERRKNPYKDWIFGISGTEHDPNPATRAKPKTWWRKPKPQPNPRDDLLERSHRLQALLQARRNLREQAAQAKVKVPEMEFPPMAITGVQPKKRQMMSFPTRTVYGRAPQTAIAGTPKPGQSFPRNR